MTAGKHTILFALGTRPEGIKLAPLALAMRKNPSLNVILASSGQHQNMLHSALDVFGLTLDHDFQLMDKVKGLPSLTGQIIEKYSGLFADIKPDLVVVHGDTTTTLCGALAAYYTHVPIAHVEAGLRTYQKYHSFPEETNRRMVATITDLHFAPTESARQNLLSEHIPAENIFVTGNTVIDALEWVRCNKQDPFGPGHKLHDLVRKPFILVTAHRRESWGKAHRQHFAALQQVAEKMPHVPVIFPIHPNPAIREEAKQFLKAPNIHMIEPQDYHHFVFLMHHCTLLVTDSGSIQEEITFLGKPTLVIRSTTERVDALQAGNTMLADAPAGQLAQYILTLLSDASSIKKMSQASTIYGDGTAAQQITDHICAWLKSR